MQLRIIKGHDAGRLLELDRPVFAVGREPDNDFIVPDPQISRYHCVFQERGGKWSVKDLDSRNGVSVNGKKIQEEHPLAPGDEVTLYNLVLKLQDPSQELLPLAAFEPQPKTEGRDEQHRRENNPLDKLSHDQDIRLLEPEGLQEPQENKPAKTIALIIPIAKIIFFIAILIAIAVLVYMLTVEPEKTPRQQEHVNSQHAQQQNAQDKQQPQDKTPENAQASAKTAEIPAELPPPPPENSRKQPREKGKERPETTTPKNRKTTAAPPPVAPRSIVVTSVPEGADVFLQGRKIGKTPAVLQNLGRKQITLQLKLQGYETMTRRIDVNGGLQEQPLRLIQKTGTIRINTDPQGASVSEGRHVYGTTPLLIQNIAPGEHQFTLERKGYETQQVTVNLSEAKGETLQATLVSNLGALEITTTPAACQIYLDGLLVGTTTQAGQEIVSQPLKLQNLIPGRCTIKVLHTQTGTFDNITALIPPKNTLRKSVFIWIPTHKVIKLDSKTVTGMILGKDQDSIVIMDVEGKKHDILKQEYTDIIPISKEDQTFILQNRAAARGPSGQLSTKSKLSILTTDFLQQADFPSFRGYVRQKLCITGKVTSRMKTPKETTIYFGKQEIRCQMAPTASADDYKKIGELKKQGRDVSLRGIYEGVRKDVHIFSNCVLLPYPD